MSYDYDRARQGGSMFGGGGRAHESLAVPGKRTLTEALPPANTLRVAADADRAGATDQEHEQDFDESAVPTDPNTSGHDEAVSPAASQQLGESAAGHDEAAREPVDAPTAAANSTPASPDPGPPLFADTPQWEAIETNESAQSAEPVKREAIREPAAAGRPLGRARAMAGTAHRRFSLSMSTQVTEAGLVGWGVEDRVRKRTAAAARVDVKAQQASPLVVEPGTRPTDDQLVERSTQGKHRVTHQRGTLEKPNTHHVMDNERLFIGGKPDAADIRQGGLGDCYFQAALLAVVANDPEQIRKMITMAGDEATVTFYRFDRGRANPVRIRTSDTLLTARDEHGSRQLVGARVRRAAAPRKTSWWASVIASTLEYHRRDVWEVALWAALIEKAYAHFAELHGRFGFKLTDDDRKAGGGYDIVNQGGWTEECFRVIYGSAAAKPELEDTTFSTEDDIVLNNPESIARLVEYESTRTHTGPGEKQGFLEAHMDSVEAIERCRAQSDVVLRQIWMDQSVDAMMGIMPSSDESVRERSRRTTERGDLKDNIAVLHDAMDGFNYDDEKTGEALATVAVTLLTPELFPALWDDARSASYAHLRESLGLLTHLGSFNLGKRSIITSHAYNVKSVQLRDRRGAALVLKPADVGARLRDIDATRSTVVIENPHAGNEMDLRGDGPADKRPDGRFSLTLDQFLRMFGTLAVSAVTR